MGLLKNRFRSQQKGSAELAKERLKIIVAHERAQRGGPKYLPMMRDELLDVIRKYAQVEPESVTMELGRDGDYDVLELNVILPDPEVRG